MISSAALCPWPPLLVRELTGADPVLPELRAACAEAVATLLRDDPEVVAVVGPGTATVSWPGDGRLNIAAFGPGATAARPAERPVLPRAPGAGALRRAGRRLRRGGGAGSAGQRPHRPAGPGSRPGPRADGDRAARLAGPGRGPGGDGRPRCRGAVRGRPVRGGLPGGHAPAVHLPRIRRPRIGGKARPRSGLGPGTRIRHQGQA